MVRFDRGKLLLRCGLHCRRGRSAARGAQAPTEEGEGRGHIVAAARLQLVYIGLSAAALTVVT